MPEKQVQLRPWSSPPAPKPPTAPVTTTAVQRPWTGVPGPEPLLEPEYAPHVTAYQKNPTPETAGQLLKAVDPVIDESLRSYAGTEANTATLKARAKTMTLEAVRRYDPQRAKLRTHLLSHLRGLRRVSERATAGVYVPEQAKINARVVDAAARDLQDELGREAGDAEIADRTGLTLSHVRKARAIPGVVTSSQFGGEVAAQRPDQKAWDLWVSTVWHDLPPVDQMILDHSFGLHEKPVLPAHVIAKKVNLSPGAVSLRKAKIQNMLDEYDKYTGFRGG